MRVLLLAKKNHWVSQKAAEFLQLMKAEIVACAGKRGDPLPEDAKYFKGDMILSVSSPWIVPGWVRKEARTAVNFHPGPPEYPGIGCTNFALYEGARSFGATAHHMEDLVDSGQIIAVKRIPIYDDDSVMSLTDRTYHAMYALFVSVVTDAFSGVMPRSEEVWTRRPFTRKELDALCRCTPDMTEDEIQRRVRATAFPGQQGAYIEAGKVKFNA